jgi:hypothetical protein
VINSLRCLCSPLLPLIFECCIGVSVIIGKLGKRTTNFLFRLSRDLDFYSVRLDLGEETRNWRGLFNYRLFGITILQAWTYMTTNSDRMYLRILVSESLTIFGSHFSFSVGLQVTILVYITTVFHIMALSPNFSQRTWFLYNGLHWPSRLLHVCEYAGFFAWATPMKCYTGRELRECWQDPSSWNVRQPPSCPVGLPVINLPSSAPLDNFASLAITLLWVVARSFSSFSVPTLHQDPGILCQPRRDMCVPWLIWMLELCH